MAIIINLDRLISGQQVVSKELAKRIRISENNLSRIKTGKIKAIRFSTLNGLCRELECHPGHILDYVPEEDLDPNKHIICWMEDEK